MRSALAAAGVLALAAGSATAQVCRPAANSNEAEMFAIMSLPLAFGAAGAPVRPAPGAVAAGFELSLIPQISAATRTPLTCRPGKGPENANLMPVVPRPRLSLGLPAGFAMEASWIPPLRVRGVKSNLFGVALGRSFGAGAVTLTARGHATFGTVHAAITCDGAALADSSSECLSGTLSDDTYRPNIMGVDVAASWAASPTLVPSVGVGLNLLRPRFQVHFLNSASSLDTTKIIVNLSRVVLFGGLTWQARERLALGGELYLAPKDGATVRVVARRRLGG